jgi:hypothetical protein
VRFLVGLGLVGLALVNSAPALSDREALEPGMKWRVVTGSSKIDWINRLIQTRDGAIVAVGFLGRDPDAKALERWTATAIKYSLDGKYIWSRDFATPGMNAFWSVCEASGGQLVIGGFSSSAPSVAYDARLTVLSENGVQITAKTFGGPKDDRATDVLITRDGGYLLIGQTESFGAGERDVFLVKTDSRGSEKWQKTYGGPGMDRGFAAVETNDGGFVVIGTTGSESKIVGLVFKVDKDGGQIWWRTLPADHNVVFHAVNLFPDGRLLITGYTNSWDSKETDFLAVTLSPQGDISRIETLGGAAEEHGITAADDRKGGAWLAGYSKSFGDGAWHSTLAHIRPDGSFEPGVIALNLNTESFATTAATLSDGDLVVGGYARTGGPTSSVNLMLMRIDPDKANRVTENVSVKRVQ